MKLAIVGLFYDGYKDMWEDFLILLRKYWPECPYNLYIINQLEQPHYAEKYNVKVINAGKDAEFSKKMYLASKEIDADYYLFLLEDFFFGKMTQRDVLEHTLKLIEEKEIRYLGFKLPLMGQEKDDPRIIKIKTTDEYTIVSAYNIFERKFVQECVGSDNYNAWIFEGIYAKARKVHTSDFLKGCYRSKSNPLNLHHGALQGKFLPQTKKYFLKNGYHFISDREFISKKDYCKQYIKRIAITFMPRNLRKHLKKYPIFSSITGKYAEEIDTQIKKMNLD